MGSTLSALFVCIFHICSGNYIVDVRRPMSALWKVDKFDYEKSYSNYLGCYHYEEVRTWVRSERIQNLMTLTACIDSCSNMEMTFSGVFKGTECYCTDKVPSMVIDDLACNRICPGNIGLICGGMDAGVVYQVCRPGRFGLKCGLPCFCLNYMPCNYITGVCYFRGCRLDYKGNRCALGMSEKNNSEGMALLVDRYPDWKSIRGVKIPLNCALGRYGLYCKAVCHCKTQPCHRVTGLCNDGCKRGWMGGRCDKNDPCYDNPCLNGGTCKTYYPEAVCTCPQEFIGVRCQRADPCLSTPCENGGSCRVVGDTFDCVCEGDFSGSRCEINVAIFQSSPFYIGCARDGRPELREEHSLSEEILVGHGHDMNITKCTVRCRARLYTFAGLQGGRKCFCGNDYGRYGMLPDSSCSSPCTGNPSEMCGGKRTFSIYTVCPVGKFREDCMDKCHCGGYQPCLLAAGRCPYPTCSVGFEGASCNVEVIGSTTVYENAKFYYKAVVVLFTVVCTMPTAYFVIKLAWR